MDVLKARLYGMSKDTLINILLSLSSQTENFENFLQTKLDTIATNCHLNDVAVVDKTTVTTTGGKIEKKKKDFDINKYRQRVVAIQLQYEGGSYYGFASQTGECDDTIEKHIFEALLKLKLIQDRPSCSYTRCGRTDKGVSALGQVVSFSLRSAIPLQLNQASTNQKDIMVASSSGTSKGIKTVNEYTEIDYCFLLNKVLPDNIKALGWTEVTPEFSARFSAQSRIYRYFFVQGAMNISAMKQGATYLLGDHDFRNLCKMDLANVTNYVRSIYKAEIVCFQENVHDPSLSIWMLEITGIAFLWHMIRCIMAVLLMIGSNQESPEIILFLLDIKQCIAKPNYNMADELPLVLHECDFENLTISYQPRVLWSLTAHFKHTMETHLIAYARAKNAYTFLQSRQVVAKDLIELVHELDGKKQRSTSRLTSLLHRNTNNINNSNNDESQSKLSSSTHEGICFNSSSSLSSSLPASSTSASSSLPASSTSASSSLPAMKRSRSNDNSINVTNTSDMNYNINITQSMAPMESHYDTDFAVTSSSSNNNSSSGSSNNNSSSGSSNSSSSGSSNNTNNNNNNETYISWIKALSIMNDQYGYIPTEVFTPHIPLKQRKCVDEYATRVDNLSGKKKERYDRHVILQGTQDSKSFFAKMRKEGSKS